MGHTTIEDLHDAVDIQPGAVVSKVIYRDGSMNVTVFGFDTGEGLTEHTAARIAVVEVLAGRLRLTVGAEIYEAGPGFWLRMDAGAAHDLLAEEPTLMLLTMIGS